MADQQPEPQEESVCTSWQHMLQGVLGIVLFAGTVFLVQQYMQQPPSPDLHKEIQQLSLQVQQLQQEQAMPSMVLNRYRNSICYIFGVYRVGYPNQRPALRARVSGTGFVVAQGMLATNRHVAQPWYGDSEAEGLIHTGAKPQLEKLMAFFPGLPTPVNITPLAYSAQGDLAVLHMDDEELEKSLRPLPLAAGISNPGELVTVIGYPMGVLGMVAKSPAAVYERLAYRRDDMNAANELAALSLIRPSATCGHLGDVVGDKLIYDAPTAHGGSGGPVFNSHGEVIGINSAYIDGFSGGTLGVSVQALKPVMDAAQKRQP
ncbi:MAG: trypsin-like peptidase domain-containing protein [Acidobacteria bacterium]|nr:trypsin-like peptidase domain-containing protein [Acidobacteriota bacterium]